MATGDEHIEEPTEPINGVNVDFTTVHPYQAGTLRGFVNGLLKRPQDDDGLIETSPATGQFQMKEPPRGGVRPDTLHVRYLEA